MKRIWRVFSALALMALLVCMMIVPALAHGGHGRGTHSGKGGGTSTQPRYAICTAEDCVKIGLHQHDDVWYCSQSKRTGDYALCTVEGCAELGLHQHDGVYYCQKYGTGRGCGKGRNR